MKTHTYCISVDTRKRILLKTIDDVARIDCHSFPDLKSACRGIITTKHGGGACYGISYASGKRNCLFAVKFCFIQHHDDFMPKTNSCSKSSKITRFIWVQFEQEIGFVDQEDFEFDGLVAKANAERA